MISIKDLSFSYGSKKVLKNITMDLQKGNIYGLLGENGVGKTTLLTLLSGLKKPQSGSIETDGRNPFDRHPSLLAEQFYLPDEVSPVPARALDFGKETGIEDFRRKLEDFKANPTKDGILLKGRKRTTVKLFIPDLYFAEKKTRLEMGDTVWVYMGEYYPCYCVYWPQAE